MTRMPDAPRPSVDPGILPLRPGDRGPQVADLQLRLVALEHEISDPDGEYGQSTESAVRSFQTQRGLHQDGTCDTLTWEALVEAGYRLGDRLLYRTAPMLRGDDVAELQRQLSSFGFDCGRIDGIFGDHTAAALLDFQRNVGLSADGLCGHRSIAELQRLFLHQRTSELVSLVREEQRLRRRDPGLEGRRVGVAEGGGFATGLAALCRALGDAGAIPVPLRHPDPSRQAAEANAAEVDCVLSIALDAETRSCSTAFYRGFRYESPTSRRLAELVQATLPAALSLDDGGIHGMALPLLRETRMPAVDVRLGSPAIVVQRTAEVAHVLVAAVQEWSTFGAPRQVASR